MTAEQATENLKVLLDALQTVIPGGDLNYKSAFFQCSKFYNPRRELPALPLGNFILPAGVRVLPEYPIDDVLNGVVNELVLEMQKEGVLLDDEAKKLRRPAHSVYM